MNEKLQMRQIRTEMICEDEFNNFGFKPKLFRHVWETLIAEINKAFAELHKHDDLKIELMYINIKELTENPLGNKGYVLIRERRGKIVLKRKVEQ